MKERSDYTHILAIVAIVALVVLVVILFNFRSTKQPSTIDVVDENGAVVGKAEFAAGAYKITSSTKPTLPTNPNTLIKKDILQMLNQCSINSMLASKNVNPSVTGNDMCKQSGSTMICTETYMSTVPNPENPDFKLTNTLRVGCSSKYEGDTNAYYIQAVCCEAKE